MHRIRFFLVSSLAVLAFAFAPSTLSSEEACEDREQSCAPQNQWGAQLVGVNDITYDDGCLECWDCVYSDGFQTRHCY